MKNWLVFQNYAILAGVSLLSALVRAGAVSFDAPNTSLYADTEAMTNVVLR